MEYHLFGPSRWLVNFEDALCWALSHGSTKSANWLLEAGADPQEARASGPCDPLASAALRGMDELFYKILKSDITLPYNDLDLLNSAIAGGSANIVETVLSRCALVKSDKTESDVLVRSAAKSGNVKIMKLLKEYKIGINVSCGDNIFNAPIAIAMLNHKTDMVNYLLEEIRGVAKTIDDSGRTLLHVAAQAGLSEYVKPLVDSGASISQADNSDVRPVHVACRKDSKETLQALIAAMNPSERETNLNAIVQDSGDSPLHIAVKAGLLPAVTVLLESGANQNIKNLAGETPLDIATCMNNTSIVSLLQK